MWTLCSKEDVQALFRIPTASLEDEWSEFTEGLIKNHLREPYLGTRYAVVDELLNGSGSYLQLVKCPPVISVEAVSIDGYALAPADYILRRGGVEALVYTFTKGHLNVKMSYTTGSPFLQGDTTQYFLGDETATITVSLPIYSITSVVTGEVMLDPTAYTFSGSAITLVSGVFALGEDIYVHYQPSAPFIDPTVRLCAATMVAAMSKFKSRQGGEKSFKWDEADSSRGVGDTEQDYIKVGLTSYLTQIMKRTLQRGRVRCG